MNAAKKKIDEETLKTGKLQTEISRLTKTNKEYEKRLEEGKSEEIDGGAKYVVLALKYIESN